MPDNVNLDTLTRPFPREAIKQREAVRGGKKLDYVEGHTVIHRLNEATGNQWEFAVRDLHTSVVGQDQRGDDIILVRAHVALTLPGLGTREHIGVQAVRANAGEDLVKGAVTDALKKAATLFGVGLELYGPDYEAGEIASVERQNAPRATQPRPQAPQYPGEPDKWGPGTGGGPVREIEPHWQAQQAHPDPVREVQAIERQQQNGNRPTGVQRPNDPPTEKQINWAQGMWKQLGHTILGPDGEVHHDPTTLDTHCAQFYGAPFGQLTRGQMSELLNDLSAQTRAGRR